MPAIQFGIGVSAPGAGRLRQVRTAMSRKRTPTRILPHAIALSVDVLVDALPATAAEYANPLTGARATIHPTMNSGPLIRARWEKSIRMTAMIGTGLIATPTANPRTVLVPSLREAVSSLVGGSVPGGVLTRRRRAWPG